MCYFNFFCEVVGHFRLLPIVGRYCCVKTCPILKLLIYLFAYKAHQHLKSLALRPFFFFSALPSSKQYSLVTDSPAQHRTVSCKKFLARLYPKTCISTQLISTQWWPTIFKNSLIYNFFFLKNLCHNFELSLEKLELVFRNSLLLFFPP